MAFPYVRHSADWKDADSALGGGDESTPITATALDNIEAGIDSLSNILENADAAGDLLVASGADAWTKLTKGADDEVLSVAAGSLDYRKIVNAMIDAAAAIAISKLADYPSDATKFLRGDATWAAAGAAALTAALPASPSNGDEIIFVDSLTAPTYAWHLRYISAKASNKWQFVGGSGGYNEITTAQSPSASGSYLALATAGPSFAIPVAGDYAVEIGHKYTVGSAAAEGRMSYDIGGTGAVDADAAHHFSGGVSDAASIIRVRIKSLTAVTLTAKYKSNGTTGTFADRWMRVIPVAIGG